MGEFLKLGEGKKLRHLVKRLRKRSALTGINFEKGDEEVQAEKGYAYSNCGSGRLGQAQDIHSSFLHDA